MWIVLAILVLFGALAAWQWDTIQRTVLGGLKVYETTPPTLPADLKRPAVLVFSKTNGFRHEEAIPAGNALFAGVAKEKGWGYFQTENGAAFTPEILSRFDAVVFNNASGDMFTPEQRAAFKAYVENGGGYVGLHAAGDDSHAAWGWYLNEVIGTRFIQHTMSPQFQQATINVEDRAHPAAQGLPASWRHTEEWYSFDRSPRTKGYHVIATVDEKTYNPVGMFDKDLRMGDHPVVWWHCIGKGRVLYSALGHQAAAFAEPQNRRLLTDAVAWAMRQQGTECDAPAPVAKEAAQ
jgi:type 1 glutamine amidotransferase